MQRKSERTTQHCPRCGRCDNLPRNATGCLQSCGRSSPGARWDAENLASSPRAYTFFPQPGLSVKFQL